MAAIAHGYQEQTTDQTHTGNTDWTTVFTVDDSNFTAGGIYLILVSAQVGGSNANAQFGIRVAHGGTPTVFTESEYIYEPTNTSAAQRHDYFVPLVFTQPGTPEDIVIQIQTITSSANTVRADTIGVFWIRLDDGLATPDDWNVGTDTTSDAHTTSFQNYASTTITSAASEDWLVIASARVDVGSVTNQMQYRINRDSDTETDPSWSFENENTVETVVKTIFRTYTLSSGSHTFTMQGRDASGAANAHLSSFIFALRLTPFTDYGFFWNNGSVAATGAANITVEFANVDITPSVTQDMLILAGGLADGNVNASPIYGRIQVGGTTHPTGSDSNTETRLHDTSNDTAGPITMMTMENLANSSQDIDADFGDGFIGTATLTGRSMIVLGMDYTPTVSFTAVGDDLSSDWHVRATVNDSFISDWHVRTPLGATVTADWRIRAIVGDEAAVSWHTRAHVSDTVGIDWHTRAIVGNIPVNGHFEVNTSDWLPETGTTLTVEPEGFLGTSSMGIQQTGVTDRMRAYNTTITGGTPLGTTYEVTAWVKAGNAAALGTICEMIFWSIGGTQPQNVPLTVLPGSNILYFDDVVLTDEWQLLRIEGRIEFADRTELQIYLGATNFGGSISDGRKILADNIQIRETQLAVDQWDIRTAVGDEQVMEWNVAGVVSAVFDTVTLEWHVRSAVGDQQIMEWDLLAAIFDTAVIDWHTRLAVGNIPLNGSFEDGTTTGWFVNGDVTLSIEDEGYAGERSLGATLNSGPEWRISDYGYHIQNPPQGSKWQFRGRIKAGNPGAVGLVVGTTLYLVGGVNGPAHSPDQIVTYATLTEDWQEFGTIGSVDYDDRTSGDIYFGPGYATGLPGDIFIVDSLEIREVIEESSQWNIAQAVGDQQAIDWHTRAAIFDDFTADWNVRTFFNDEFQSDWRVRSLAGDDAVLSWHDRAHATDSTAIDWHTRMVVGNRPMNGSFETNFDTWFHNPTYIDLTRPVVADAPAGEHVMSMELIEDTIDFRVYHPGIQDLQLGSTYEARAWVKAGAPSTVGKLAILTLYFEGGTGTNHHAEAGNGVILTDEWQEIVSWGTVLHDDHLQLAFYIGAVSEDFVVGDVMLWDGFQIRERINQHSNWNVLAAIGDEQTFEWNVFAELVVGDQQAFAWHTRALVNDQVTADWHIRTPVFDTQQFDWHVRSAVGDQQAYAWNISAAVGDIIDAAWHVRALIGDNLSVDWHTRQSVSDLYSSAWNIHAAIGDTTEYAWHVRALINDTVQSAWHVFFALADEHSFEWNIESFVAVAKLLNTLWHVRALVADQQLADWHVRTFVGDQQAYDWHTRSSVGDAQEFLWHLRQIAGIDSVYNWHVRTFVDDTIDTLWHVRQYVGDDVQHLWHVLAAVSDLLAIDWHTRSLTADTIDSAWNLHALVGAEQSYAWDVLFGLTVGTARTLAWHVRQSIGDNQQLDWRIRSSVGDEQEYTWNVDGYQLTVSGIYVLRATDDGRRIVTPTDYGTRLARLLDDGRRVASADSNGKRVARTLDTGRRKVRVRNG